MQQNKVTRKATVWALLFLPLVAVGVALALMLTWSHQGTPQAEAVGLDAGIDFNISASGTAVSGGGCSSLDGGGKNASVCAVPVGTKFTVGSATKAVGGTTGTITGVQHVIGWSSGITGPVDLMDPKAPTFASCPGIGATAVDFLGQPDTAAVGCAGGPPTGLLTDAQALGFTGSFSLNCGTTPSQELVTFLVNDGVAGLKQNNSHINTTVGPFVPSSLSESITILCVPEDEQININLTSADLGNKIGPSCWVVFALVEQESPPATINKPVDVVSDNGLIPACDASGPIKSDLFDKNPALGTTSITISGANRALFGDNWSVQQVVAPPKHAVPDPSPKIACDLSLGKCSLPVTNERLQGNATINFNAGTGIDPNLMNGLCADINPGPPTKVCDGDANDNDGMANGEIAVTLPVGSHDITAQTTKDTVNQFELASPVTVNCDLVNNKTCKIDFDYQAQEFPLDVDVNEVIFNKITGENQVLDTVFLGICVNIDPGPPTQVCDGDDGDVDGRITQALVSASSPQDVTIKVPAGFKVKGSDTQNCNTAPNKCALKFDLVFNGVPAMNTATPTQQNLFIFEKTPTGDHLGIPNSCNDATNTQSVTFGATAPITRVPKSVQNPKTGKIKPSTEPQVVAGAQMSFILKDSIPNIDAACILSVKIGSYWANSACTVSPSPSKQTTKVFCATKKENVGSLNPALLNDLFTVNVGVGPALYSLLTGRQDNGTLVQIMGESCKLTDQLGHSIPKEKCPDSDLTVRQLEGDVNRDCTVDIIDQQLLTFRWNLTSTSSLFSQEFDLVDTGNQRIDVNDVQFVFGRHGSVCSKDGVTGTNPPQPPLKK